MNLENEFSKVGQQGDLEKIKKIALKNPDIIYSFGNFPLQWACLKKDLEMLKFFVEKGDKFDLYVALFFACAYGGLDIIKYLESKGVDLKRNNGEALRRAFYHGQNDIVKYLATK